MEMSCLEAIKWVANVIGSRRLHVKFECYARLYANEVAFWRLAEIWGLHCRQIICSMVIDP